MTLREEVARAIAGHIESDEDEWRLHVEAADAVIARCGPKLPVPDEEAWRVAQLAATLCGGVGAIDRGIDVSGAVRWAVLILAEARRQSGDAPALEGRADG